MVTATALTTIAADITNEHKAAQRCASQAVAHAIRAGELLIEAKAALSHGEFGPWLAANVTFSDRTARGYMRLAGMDETKRQRVADMSLRGALAAIIDKQESRNPILDLGPAVDWRPKDPTRKMAVAAWMAHGWLAIAMAVESEIGLGGFDLRVTIGNNETTSRYPVRASLVGHRFLHFGVPLDVVWNDEDAISALLEVDSLEVAR